MNTTAKYLREIRYRKARCCKNCKFFNWYSENKTGYCKLHDNVVLPHKVCKHYKEVENA